MSDVQRVYLVIGADRSVRAAKRPRITSDEVAFAVDLKFPPGWGSVIGSLSLDVPDFAPTAELATVDVTDADIAP